MCFKYCRRIVKQNYYPFIWHAHEQACGVSAMNELMFGKNGSGATFTFEKDNKEIEIELKRQDAAKIKWSQSTLAKKHFQQI